MKIIIKLGTEIKQLKNEMVNLRKSNVDPVRLFNEAPKNVSITISVQEKHAEKRQNVPIVNSKDFIIKLLKQT